MLEWLYANWVLPSYSALCSFEFDYCFDYINLLNCKHRMEFSAMLADVVTMSCISLSSIIGLT